MKTPEEISLDIIGPLPVPGYRKWAAGLGKQDLIIKAMQEYASQQVALERERIKKELLDIINLYNDNEMFGFSVAKNAIENL